MSDVIERWTKSLFLRRSIEAKLALPTWNRILARSTSCRLLFYPLLGLALLAGPALGGQVILTWDASTDSQLGGYKIYYGLSRGVYSQTVDVGNQTNYSIDGLVPGQTYFFAVTAYDRLGQQESLFSSEAQATIPALQPAPAANFTALQLSGKRAVVAFTDTSKGKITAWVWSFGDGQTSKSRNPTHAYVVPGVYSVRLMVKGSAGSNAVTKALVIVPGRRARVR